MTTQGVAHKVVNKFIGLIIYSTFIQYIQFEFIDSNLSLLYLLISTRDTGQDRVPFRLYICLSIYLIILLSINFVYLFYYFCFLYFYHVWVNWLLFPTTNYCPFLLKIFEGNIKPYTCLLPHM